MVLEPEPRFARGARVIVLSRGMDGVDDQGDSGAVLDSFPQAHGLSYEVLLDDEQLVEVPERDLRPEY